MFQWWNEAMTFVRDWPALFLLVSVVLVITVIVATRRGIKLRRAHAAEIEERNRHYIKLGTDYSILRDLGAVLHQAVSGGRHLYDAPMHITSDQDGYRLKGVQKELSRLLTNDEQSTHLKSSIVRQLQFVFLLNSIDHMRAEAEALVESKNTSENLPVFVSDFENLLQELDGYLSLRFGQETAKRYRETQLSKMTSILAQAHEIQAKDVLRWIRFGDAYVSTEKVRLFLEHCAAADIEPKSLVDPKHHLHLELLTEAIAKINEQAGLEPPSDAVAS